MKLLQDGQDKYYWIIILQENEKFRKRQNPRPWKTNIVKYHGLLRSKSVPNSELDKQILVNRDVNGSLNIRMIALCHINKKKIPTEFSRKTIIQQGFIGVNL